MKVTVVPAQVTTVEDRIMGSLTVHQVMLLSLPIFGGSLIFALLPPMMNGVTYKYILLALGGVVCVILAIRFHQKLILFWLITRLRFQMRPRYYVSTHPGRGVEESEREQLTKHSVNETFLPKEEESTSSLIPTAHLQMISKESAQTLLFYANKKGGYHVRISHGNE